MHSRQHNTKIFFPALLPLWLPYQHLLARSARDGGSEKKQNEAFHFLQAQIRNCRIVCGWQAADEFPSPL